MRRVLLILLLLLVSVAPSVAVDAPVAIHHMILSTSAADTTLTIEVELSVTNLTGAPLDQVVVRLQSATGDPAEVAGEIALGTIAAGATATAVGSVAAPAALYEGATFEQIMWRVSYVDAVGGATEISLIGTSQ
jgi:hypothetical protein